MISERYITDERLEAWVEKRFGPNSPFNRQLARDLLDWGVTEGLRGFLDTPFEQLPSGALDGPRSIPC